MAFTTGPAHSFTTDIALDCNDWTSITDQPVDLARRILAGAAAHSAISGHVDVLFTDDNTMRKLNRHWRNKDTATDILSFPGNPNQPGAESFVGDLALGYGATIRGANQWQRSMEVHLSHLLVHGFLHLLGYVHHSEAEEQIMQGKEKDILNLFGIPDPYDV